MKKVNLLSKAEMKKVMGGLGIGTMCLEGQYYARCITTYYVPTYHGSEERQQVWEGCIDVIDYNNFNGTCTIIDQGGPDPL